MHSLHFNLFFILEEEGSPKQQGLLSDNRKERREGKTRAGALASCLWGTDDMLVRGFQEKFLVWKPGERKGG